MAWRDEIVTQLENEGVGTLGENIFLSTKAAVPMLASGAATLQIILTGGTGPEGTHNSTILPAYLQPGAQLTARADSYDAADDMAKAAYAALVKVRNQFISSGWYKWIKVRQEPFDSGVDDRKQVQIRFNVLANKRPS